MIIAFEGIDGCGKDTQIKLLSDYLTKIGKDHVVINSCSSELLSKIIRSKLKDNNTDNRQLAALFIAEQYEHLKTINQALNDGKVVILNRSFYSTIVYNSGCIKETEAIKILSIPISIKYVIYLDVGVNTALNRLSSRDTERELFETKEQLERVYVGYCYFKKEFLIVDGERPTLDVHNNILQLIRL